MAALAWVGGAGQTEAVSRSWGRPNTGTLVGTGDRSIPAHIAPNPDSIKLLGYWEKTPNTRLRMHTSPLSSGASDRGDKLMPSFGLEKYLQVKLGPGRKGVGHP